MSRIADAFARAGKRLPGEDAQRWETEHAAAIKHLGPPTSNFQLPNREEREGREEYRQVTSHAGPAIEEDDDWFLPLQPATGPSSSVLGIGDAEPRTRRNSASGETIDFELTAALRRIFLAPKSVVRSVLFCTTPGDRMTDVAWRAAELLSAQSGQRVALVEDGLTPSPHSPAHHTLVTRVGWFESRSAHAEASKGSTSDSLPSMSRSEQNSQELGERISDLYPLFPFVIVNATAPTAEDLLPLARDVDGVIVIVLEGETRRDAAKTFVIRLKDEARLLGAILIT